MTRLLDRIRAHAAARPDAVAIDGVVAGTWGELAAALPRMAAELAERFDPARPVALRIDHGASETLLDLALLEAGVPTIALPPFFTDDQIERALADAGAQSVVSGAIGREDAYRIVLRAETVAAAWRYFEHKDAPEDLATGDEGGHRRPLRRTHGGNGTDPRAVCRTWNPGDRGRGTRAAGIS